MKFNKQRGCSFRLLTLQSWFLEKFVVSRKNHLCTPNLVYSQFMENQLSTQTHEMLIYVKVLHFQVHWQKLFSILLGIFFLFPRNCEKHENNFGNPLYRLVHWCTEPVLDVYIFLLFQWLKMKTNNKFLRKKTLWNPRSNESY